MTLLQRFTIALCLSTAALHAQQTATDLRVENRNGQTFIVWREVMTTPSPTRYRIWRSSKPIGRASDLALFRSKERSNVNTETIVLITPRLQDREEGAGDWVSNAEPGQCRER